MMKSVKKQLSKNKIKLIITVDPQEMEAHFENELSKLAPTVTIPGFRPGKAPRVMLIESIGHSRLSQLSLERGINQAFQQALMEHRQMPVNQPAISISKYPSFSDDKEKNELVFEVEYDVISEAKVGDYKKLKIKKSGESDLSVSDEEVAGVIKYLQRQRAVLTEKKDKAEKGDWMELSFEGSIKRVAVEKLTSSNMPVLLGETKLIPGFEEKIVGMKKGEKREFEINFAKDFPDNDLAGKTANFKVECLTLNSVKLPEVNKEFLQAFGLNDEKTLRTNIKNSLIQEKKERDFEVKKMKIAEELIAITKVEIPRSMVEQEAERMRTALEADLKNKGMTLEQYQKNLKIDDKKMQDDLIAQSRRNITLGVALGEVAKKEQVTISDQKGVDELYRKLIEILGL